MLKNAQKMSRGEGGFTLIELLVVMIIIAILMAVAVPTFLRQKQSALGTKAKANIKAIATTIDACAASNVDGTYTGSSNGVNCTLPATLTDQEPGIGALLAAGGDGQGNTYTVAAIGDYGYSVTANVKANPSPAVIIESHAADGVVTKTCTGNTKVCGGQAGGKW